MTDWTPEENRVDLGAEPFRPAGAAERRDARPFRERLEDGGEPVQVVSFRIGGELYGCDILLVEEVVTRRKVHPLPDMPHRLLGVLRLRDELIPVLDVAPLLDLALAPAELRAVMVVGTDEARIGIAADAVLEVVTLPPGAALPAPVSGAERDQYVAGVARLNGGLLNLIDLAEILRAHTTLTPGNDR
jgi:purine-binding chemotaxis protein CheW